MPGWDMPTSGRIDALFTDWDRPDGPGCAIGIVHEAELHYARGYGMANLDRLHLSRHKFPDQPLDPTIIDGLAADRYQIDFERDANGAVTRFALTTGRIRRVRFDRVD